VRGFVHLQLRVYEFAEEVAPFRYGWPSKVGFQTGRQYTPPRGHFKVGIYLRGTWSCAAGLAVKPVLASIGKAGTQFRAIAA